MGIIKNMKESSKQKLSRLLTKIASLLSLDSSMRLKPATVGIPSFSILEIRRPRRKHPWRWQSKLLNIDRILGENDLEPFGKQSL